MLKHSPFNHLQQMSIEPLFLKFCRGRECKIQISAMFFCLSWTASGQLVCQKPLQGFSKHLCARHSPWEILLCPPWECTRGQEWCQGFLPDVSPAFPHPPCVLPLLPAPLVFPFIFCLTSRTTSVFLLRTASSCSLPQRANYHFHLYFYTKL